MSFCKRTGPRRFYTNGLSKKELILLIASRDKEPIGYLIAELPVGGVSLIMWLAVKKTCQGRGVAGLLLQQCEAIVKKQRAHKLHLWTSKRNVEFYKKKGYKLGGFIPNNYFGAENYLFYKTLQKPNY